MTAYQNELANRVRIKNFAMPTKLLRASKAVVKNGFMGGHSNKKATDLAFNAGLSTE